MLSPGLGHVYCGVITRGLALQVSSLLALIVAILGLLASPPARGFLVGGSIIVALVLVLYSAVDARRLALRTREDYRLKDYNRPLVYGLLAALSMLVAPLVAIVIRGWVLSAWVMVGDSNFPSLLQNDRVLVDKQAYRSIDPQPGDEIAFLNPNDRKKHWIKRVIARAGDTVEIQDGKVFINGRELATKVIEKNVDDPGDKGTGRIIEETNGNARYKIFQLHTPPSDQTLRNSPAVTIPGNHVYVLGDHRDNSLDSRQFGPISIFSIEGKVSLHY